jgi:hypothetical protein
VTAEAVYERARDFAPRVSALVLILMIGFVGATLNLYVRRTTQFVQRPTVPFADVCSLFGDRYNAYARQLGLKAGSLLLPDVGGALYCSELRIYDLGALTDRTMADAWRKGKAGLREHILGVLKPTFIHVHGGWAAATEFENDERFLRDYAPIQSGAASLFKEGPYFVGDYVRRDAVGEKLETLRGLARSDRWRK